MIRVFTKPVGRFSPGEEKDWPVQTWKTLATNVGKSMEEWSRPVEDVLEDGAVTVPVLLAKIEALQARVDDMEKGRKNGSKP